jgi:dynein heavy chain
MNLKISMWKSLTEWDDLTHLWIETEFNSIDTESIKKKAEFYTKIIQRCIKNLAPNPVIDILKKKVYEFKDTMPVVIGLRNPAIRPHHFEEIKKVIGRDFVIN